MHQMFTDDVFALRSNSSLVSMKVVELDILDPGTSVHGHTDMLSV